MKTAAPDFKIFWDEAYIVHHLTEEIIETPVSVEREQEVRHGEPCVHVHLHQQDHLPGAGVSAIACSVDS